MIAQQILAAIGLAVCLILIGRLLLRKPQQHRLDAAARRLWLVIKLKAVLAWRWRRLHRNAQQAATDAINRASAKHGQGPRGADGVWKGNVYESKSFRKPRKPH